MSYLPKKIVFSVLSFLIVFLSVAPHLSHVKADNTWYSQDPLSWYLKVFDQSTSPPNEIFGERYTAAQVQWVVYGFMSLPLRALESVIGEGSITCFFKLADATADPKACVEAFSNFLQSKTDLLEITPNIISSSNNNKGVISSILNPDQKSISGISYTKNLLKKFSLVSEVKAQGYGYDGLNWIQKYWTGFRNISYALLTLVIVIFAFMIMFRTKINPQTVISVQSALPKVVITLILITFSYAIAGFAIDLMYVFSGLLATLTSAAFDVNVTKAFGYITGTSFGQATLGGFWIFFAMLLYSVTFFFAALVSFFTTFAAGLNSFGMILSFVFMLISVWLLIITIWYTIKIPYIMIKTLISVYVSIITSPVQILAGALFPSAGFGSWFKRLMADILVFPVIGFFVLMAWILLVNSFPESVLDYLRAPLPNLVSKLVGGKGASPAWVPEILGSRAFFQASGSSGIIFLGMSFTVITLISKVPDLLKSIILGERFLLGTAMGEAVGLLKTGWGLTGAPYVNTAQKVFSEESLQGFRTRVQTWAQRKSGKSKNEQ